MAFLSALIVAGGGALGAVTRFWLSGAIARRIGELFPWGTLTVNVSGALIIGASAAALPASNAALSLWRLALVTGFLGGYTTVSSFALQTLSLARIGETRGAVINVVASLLLCIGAAAAGFAAVSFIAG